MLVEWVVCGLDRCLLQERAAHRLQLLPTHAVREHDMVNMQKRCP